MFVNAIKIHQSYSVEPHSVNDLFKNRSGNLFAKAKSTLTT